MYARIQSADSARRDAVLPAGQAGEESRARLVDTIAGHPGFAGLYLWSSSATHAARVVMSTELLPGEDVALLPGPDRIERHRVAHSTSPALTT